MKEHLFCHMCEVSSSFEALCEITKYYPDTTGENSTGFKSLQTMYIIL